MLSIRSQAGRIERLAPDGEYHRCMARLCERPGCSVVADTTYGFDAEQLMVWIDRFETGGSGRAGVLCLRHADAMVVPLGWMLDDRRNPTPQLFRTPVATPIERATARVRHGKAHGDAVALGAMQQLGFDVDQPSAVDRADDEQIVVEFSATAACASDDSPIDPWKPVFDQTDDLGGLLSANSPLLSRAFRGSSRP